MTNNQATLATIRRIGTAQGQAQCTRRFHQHFGCTASEVRAGLLAKQ